ncbi:hypothetical protein ACTS93_15265 [Empedobacter falsenii]
MENTEYYEGLYKFLTKTTSGLMSTTGEVVILITNNALVCSVGNNVRDEYIIKERTITNHSLVLEGVLIDQLTDLDIEDVFKIVKTEKFDSLGKPLFNVKYRDCEDYFTLFLIKPEEN